MSTLSTFALFPQKRRFSYAGVPTGDPPPKRASPTKKMNKVSILNTFTLRPHPRTSPTHHSLLRTHHSIPMSTFALFAQKRGFGAAGVPTGDPPPGRASPTKKMNKVSILNTSTLRPHPRTSPTHHSLLRTHHSSPLSNFALFPQKRGFGAAGALTGDHATRPGGYARQIVKNRSIFPCFAQNRCFLPLRYPAATFRHLITHYSSLITSNRMSTFALFPQKRGFPIRPRPDARPGIMFRKVMENCRLYEKTLPPRLCMGGHLAGP